MRERSQLPRKNNNKHKSLEAARGAGEEAQGAATRVPSAAEGHRPATPARAVCVCEDAHGLT